MSFLGGVFKTLSYRVDKEISESLYVNEIFLKSQWGWLERSVIRWSTQYIKYITLTSLLALFIAFNILLSGVNYPVRFLVKKIA
jgi:hypothetical protein